MKTLITVVAFVWLTGSMAAQTRVHRNIGVESGLVQSQVISLHFDKNGYLWIGTLGGLSRWDGVRFRNFGLREGLTSIAILSIAEGPDSTLFFGTSAGGINIYRHGRFSRFSTEEGLSNQTVRSMAVTGKNWYVGTDNGLNIVDHPGNRESVVNQLFEGNRISALLVLNDSTLWVGNYDEGLFQVQNGKTTRLGGDPAILGRGVRQILRLRDGRIIVLNERHGVVIWNGTAFEIPAYNRELKQERQVSVFEDSRGLLYFGSISEGVLVVANGRTDRLGMAQGMANAQVTAFGEAPSGQIVFGTWGGISVYDHDRIVSYTTDDGLTDNIILSLTQLSDGSMLFGSYRGSMDQLAAGKVKPLSGWNGSSSIWSLYSPDGKSFYAGTHSDGAYYWDGARWHHYEKQLVDNRVYSVLRTREGETIFTTRQGISVQKGGEFSPKAQTAGLQRDFYYTVCERKNGDLLFGTRQGVIVHSFRGIDTIDQKDGLADNHVWSIKEGPDDKIYVGTNAGGLNVINGREISIYNSESGLSDNTIYGIEFDRMGRCYVATNKGVNVLTFEDGEMRVRVLRKSDGLANDECSQGAVFKDRDGRLWFGTIGGVSCLDPEKENESSYLPRVHITRFRVFENDVRIETLSPNHVFNYNENYLKFDFVGINFSAPDRVQYRYRMSGVDKSWVETNRDFVQYSNLNDGSYLFELMASNEWGKWSDPLRFSFSIEPPFWERWWFVLLVFLVVGGTAFLVVYSRVQQVLALERLRSKIAADFHDTIGAGLTQVHVLSQVAVSQAQNREDVVRHLNSIDQVSNLLYEEMRDIVWLVNPKKDTLYDLLVRLQESHEDLLNEKDITFETVNLNVLDKVRLSMEQRQHIYMIFREALNNSIKYGECSSIKLEVKRPDKRLVIVYVDDGRGFEITAVKRGNGLNNMEERARKIGGLLRLETGPGKGFHLELSIKT